MDNLALQRLRDAITQYDKIGIAIGSEALLDEWAAALSLYLVLQEANKEVSIVSASQPIVEYSSLVGIDKVKSSFGGLEGDLIVSFPYNEGEIEKVSYKIEDGYLNIIVKAGEQGLTFSEQDVLFNRSNSAPSLLFIVGTPRLSDLGNLFNPELLKDTIIVNIDNKQENQGYGDILFVSTKFSTVSEQIAQIMLNLGLSVDVDAAQNLLLGIIEGTNNFQDPKTSYIAFEMAAEMMRRGAIRNSGQSKEERIADPVIGPKQSATSQRPPSPFLRNQASNIRQQSPFLKTHPQPQPSYIQRSQSTSQQPQTVRNRAEEIRQALAREQQRQQMRNQQINKDFEKQQNFDEEETKEDAPSDWLTPKVYKGSSDVH